MPARFSSALTRLGALRAKKRKVAIYGGGPEGKALSEAIKAQRSDYHLVGVFDDRGAGVPGRTLVEGLQGTSDDLLALGQRQRLDQLIIALPRDARQRSQTVVAKLCAIPAEISIVWRSPVPAEDMDTYRDPHLAKEVLFQAPPKANGLQLRCLLDPLIAALAVAMLSPLLILIGVLIKLDTPGPVLFRQVRYGYRGRPFMIYKFRTMRDDMRDAAGARQCYANDFRVTAIGGILRRTRLDELPQLFNLMKGEMCLIGPRPHPIGMRTRELTCPDLVPNYFARYRIKPGMTGWAQVNGWDGPISTPAQLQQRVKHDLFYIEHRSFRLDLRILQLTVAHLLGTQRAVQLA